MNAWEKRKLGEVADIRGGGTPSTSKPEYWDGEIDWYAPAEIGTQRYVSGSRRQITKLGLNKSSATMLPANKTILFTSRAGIGNAAILTNSGATNQGFQSIVVKPATDVYFLYSEIPEIKRKAIRLAAGSTFIEISGKSLTKIQIRLPSFKEQSRIGHLFLQIDNLIDATQGKLDCLVKVKKALLQHLFDQSIRFKGYSDPWEKRKLIDQLSLLKDGTHGTHKDGNFAFLLSAKNVIQNSIVFDDSDRKISEDDFNDIYANYHIKKNDVLLTIVGTIGRVALFPRLTVPVAFQRSVAILRTKPTLFPYFLALELQTPSIQSKIKSRANMSAQAGIYLGDLKKVIIAIPKSEEQMEIAMSLKRLTNLIAATQHKIEKLELAKEATLQHMFNKSWKISGNFPSWKDADLGSLNLDISDGDWIESEHIHRTGSYRIIQTGNIGLGIFVDKSETAKYIHQSDYDELHANEVFPGDILICRLAEPAGRAIILPDIHHRMVTVVDVAVIRPSSQINAYFLVSELNRPKVLHEVGTLTSGSTRKRISRKNLEKVNLEMPSIDEQNKIAIIVESFSNIISLTQSNLTNLKTVKAFLMQSLFA